MKIFIDTANLDEIRAANAMAVLDGVTTNPTLISREGRPFVELVQEICSIVDGPVNVEVVGTTAEAMVEEARELAAIHSNIVVKIPMIKEGLKAVKTLSGEGIKTTVTLVFSCTQALLAAKAGATYAAPFIGRLDDEGHTGMDLIRQIRTVYDNYDLKTQIIVASIRHPLHVTEAAMIGAEVATVPFAIIEKMLRHRLTEIGLEKFLSDWQKVPGS